MLKATNSYLHRHAGLLVYLSALLFSYTQLGHAAEHEYLRGFGNHFTSESLEGALPANQNSPQRCPYGLYAEQLSGTAFTRPRDKNKYTWLYRIRPSVIHTAYIKIDKGLIRSEFSHASITPNQLLWKPFPYPTDSQPKDFVEGLVTITGSGSAGTKTGLGIHIYSANRSMENKCFSNADGGLLIVPQEGALDIQTECGFLAVSPGEICMIPRGMRFRVATKDPNIRGYICEVYEGHFELPNLGPIGANGLANPRDFLTPVAHFEDLEVSYTVITKFSGELFRSTMEHSPFDVVAYHGNYVPFKYDLSNFCAMNTVNFDHADPGAASKP